MKPVLPKQHGAWAMLLIPFLLGIIEGQAVLIHIPLFIGWFFLYLATYPILMTFKNNRKKELYVKWSFYYGTPATIALLVVLVANVKMIYFGLIMIPFFLINAYFAKQKNERALINDVSAIIVFCLAGIASYYASTGTVDSIAISIFFLPFLFFAGSTFFVKTMIREKKNPLYKWISWGYHATLIVVLPIFINPLFVLAYIPSLIRSIVLYGKGITMMKIGVLEIINSIFFFTVMVFLL